MAVRQLNKTACLALTAARETAPPGQGVTRQIGYKGL